MKQVVLLALVLCYVGCAETAHVYTCSDYIHAVYTHDDKALNAMHAQVKTEQDVNTFCQIPDRHALPFGIDTYK